MGEDTFDRIVEAIGRARWQDEKAGQESNTIGLAQAVLAVLPEPNERERRLEAHLRKLTVLAFGEIMRIALENDHLHRPMTVGYFTYGYAEGSMHEKSEPKSCIGHCTIGDLLDAAAELDDPEDDPPWDALEGIRPAADLRSAVPPIAVAGAAEAVPAETEPERCPETGFMDGSGRCALPKGHAGRHTIQAGETT